MWNPILVTISLVVIKFNWNYVFSRQVPSQNDNIFDLNDYQLDTSYRLPYYEFNTDLLNQHEKSVGPYLAFDNSWPSDELNSQLGIISAIAAIDESPTDVFVLQRDRRVWDEKTFDKMNNYLLNKSDPINKGVLAQISNGKLKQTYLPNRFFMPHGLTIDPFGNFWITDVALHQVFKFSPKLTDKPVLVLGERFKPGSGTNQFCKPTSVAVAKTGHIFIADGYCNNRIMKFNRNGKFLKQWGHTTNDLNSNNPYQLNLPHYLSILDEQDMICVADRENRRVVCYTAGLYNDHNLNQTGKYLFQYTAPDIGPLYGITIEPNRKLLFLLIGETKNEPSKVRMIDLESHTVLSDDLNTGSVEGFGPVHSISTCPSTNKKSCLLISNLNKPPTQTRGDGPFNSVDERRMWLYHLI